VASNGALTAGRRDAECALFPYQTVDRIYDSAGQIGPFTLLAVNTPAGEMLWQPFDPATNHLTTLSRSLFKSIEGDRLWFEEVRSDLGLAMSYSWSTADSHGFIRSCKLRNLTEDKIQVRLLDGLRNILPAATSQRLQSLSSNLVDAYKTSAVEPDTQFAVYALQSQIVDLPQPVESLRASIVWSTGLPAAKLLLSDDQLTRFRAGLAMVSETQNRGKRSAYLLTTILNLDPDQTVAWSVIADTNLGHAEVVSRLRQSQNPQAPSILTQAQQDSTHQLRQLVGSADGLQQSGDEAATAHHFANVLFNAMRGGTFLAGHRLPGADFASHVKIHNQAAAARHALFLAQLPDQIERADFIAKINSLGDPDLTRIAVSYLPLSFSRRHGDPSRPWNRFSIRLRDAQGRQRLAYEGNWRDIFQNWEALCLSYPEFLNGAIATFLNASTADGYNPYRITQAGIEWEEPDPEDPWASIGYWGDHQVVYLLKLLEWSQRLHPDHLIAALRPPSFSYADVPYRISDYDAMRRDPRNTITFDHAHHRAILQRVTALGADGRLLPAAAGQVHHANLTEKLLVLVLVRMTNFIPEGGIWMNTQRPEWNDANNALVGYGVSVVTLNYLRRMMAFVRSRLWTALGAEPLPISAAVVALLESVDTILSQHRDHLTRPHFDATTRRALVDDLASAGAAYRARLYADGVGPPVEVDPTTLTKLFDLALDYVDHSLRANRRPDSLFHAYNQLEFTESPGQLNVTRLPLMLEGQVAALSSGLLSAAEVVDLLHALQASDLYRADLQTYLLYPDRSLPGFMARNAIPESAWSSCPLFEAMLERGDGRLVLRDESGQAHFHADLTKAENLDALLSQLSLESAWGDQTKTDAPRVREIYEIVFNHRAFTGRSGGMFGFEGLGCIYWHMVAKLLLAVQESLHAAQQDRSPHVPELIKGYYAVRAGLGYNHSPHTFGAFPTDPYSHTPGHAGAQQPGMTGQVKEEILTRLGELGVQFSNGILDFKPSYLRASEFNKNPSTFRFINPAGKEESLALPADSLVFTVAGVPVSYQRGPGTSNHTVVPTNQNASPPTAIPGTCLSVAASALLLKRTGQIHHIEIKLGVDFIALG
jgi:hypothetical protein